jgi:hypothetical protein
MSENHLENTLEAHRNTLMLAGYVHANQKQNQQLKALGEQLEMQTKLAATEESRLKLERKRLTLEQERIAALKSEAEAVKAIRRMLVDIGGDIQQLQNETENRASSVTA